MAENTNNYHVNNTELAVLGLVAESSRHGYQVEQDIVARGMREWTEIGFSSIYYVLNKLEQEGWLESSMEAGILAGKRGPSRKIYTLTLKGQDVYRSAIRQRLASPRPRTADFALALANLPALNLSETRDAIQTQYTALSERLKAVEEKNRNDRRLAGNLPTHVEALFSYSLAQMRAELDWLTRFLASDLFDHQGEIK